MRRLSGLAVPVPRRGVRTSNTEIPNRSEKHSRPRPNDAPCGSRNCYQSPRRMNGVHTLNVAHHFGAITFAAWLTPTEGPEQVGGSLPSGPSHLPTINPMKNIEPSPGPVQWPRHACQSVECRKRDLVVRIADWTRTKDEPAYDVEVYVGGVYDFNLSQSFNITRCGSKEQARIAAAEFAAQQMRRLL